MDRHAATRAGQAELKGGIRERIGMTMDIITQCHGILCTMDEKYSGPIPEGPKVSSGGPNAGLLADAIELQEMATSLRDRLDEWVKKL